MLAHTQTEEEEEEGIEGRQAGLPLIDRCQIETHLISTVSPVALTGKGKPAASWLSDYNVGQVDIMQSRGAEWWCVAG